MQFKKCSKIIIDCNSSLGMPRCMNFWKELNGEANVCSGLFHMNCIPYTKEESKMLAIYWKCQEQKLREMKNAF